MIPLGLKIIYTLFVCALVPIYWRQYGPTNFLWFSDIALLALVPALWLENALLVSMLAISVMFFEARWNLDFFFHLATGKSLIGLGAYMFDPKIPLFIRGLSGFHIVLPLLLYRTALGLEDNLAYADALLLLERCADPNRAGADGMTFSNMLMAHEVHFQRTLKQRPTEFAALWDWAEKHRIVQQAH